MFKSKTLSGSINTVEPDCDISCIKPLTSCLDSFLTGTTKRPFLIVTTGSCTCLEWIIEFNFDLISCSLFLIDFLIFFNSKDASSEIVSSLIIAVKIVFSKLLFVYKLLNNKFNDSNSYISISSELKYSFNFLEIFRIFAKSNNCFAVKKLELSNFFI